MGGVIREAVTSGVDTLEVVILAEYTSAVGALAAYTRGVAPVISAWVTRVVHT